MNEEELRIELKLLEEQITRLKGEEKKAASAKYFKLLHSCGKKCFDDKPIYLKRS